MFPTAITKKYKYILTSVLFRIILIARTNVFYRRSDMDLKTNVVVKGSNARAVYETILNSSKRAPSKSRIRQERLAFFSKKVKASAK